MVSFEPLAAEDYFEQRGFVSSPSGRASIPVSRVLEKLDEYLYAKDFDAAERHLKYWLAEAENGKDNRGRLAVLNEQIGLYRKLGKKNEGLSALTDALDFIENLGIGDTVAGATTFLNAATAYKAFSLESLALPLYEKAKVIYEAHLSSDDGRLGGLYNNMALTLTELKRFGEAKLLYEKALSVMAEVKNGEAEMAITYCNLADLIAAEKGIEIGEKTISKYLDKALALLDTEGIPKDGYYAYICEKCAPTFGYYGRFLTEKELMKRAGEINERG